MKILHTSDWHIGRALYGRKRYEEFEAFLKWLAGFIEDEKIDVLLVAGDVFDNSTPSVDDLRNVWVQPEQRGQLPVSLTGGEGAVRLIRELEDERECDLYDVLAELGYGLPPEITYGTGRGIFLQEQGLAARVPGTVKYLSLRVPM